MGKLHHIIVIFLSLAGIILLNIGFIFLLLGFLPSVVAYFVDDTTSKDLYKTVRATNIAGILPSLMQLTHTSHPDAALQIAMSDPATWLVIYGSAAFGYFLVWLCRWLAYFSSIATGEARVMMLEKAQKDLLEEWGDEIKEYVISEDSSKTAA